MPTSLPRRRRRAAPLRRAHRLAAVAMAVSALAASAHAQDDLDDILGGFEDEDPAFDIERDDDRPVEEERWWDLSGSFEVSGTFNYLRHESDTGTNYFGLQRFRNRLNIGIDADLSEDWQARFEAWGLWDAAYTFRGRSNYTSEVLEEYELDAEIAEAWIYGKLHDKVDLKVGRQIVIWGRSETLRVLDVLNPIDNREPGRVDIEDLRRPIGMVKLDAFHELWNGDWSASLIALPEIRFDRLPPVGSDFYPGTISLPEDSPKDFEDTEVAAALTAIYSGWDVSLHGAWFWNDQPRIHIDPTRFPPSRLVHDRLWMLGAGGNYTSGSWLWKGEIAYLDGFGFDGTDDKGRLDVLFGFEYYGLTNVTISVEGTNRHVFDHDAVVGGPLYGIQEDQQEIALRYTQTFLNEKLDVTLLAVLFGWDASNGSLVRISADYDLRDALVLSVGAVLYQNGDSGLVGSPLDSWGRNDRLIFGLKWSF